MGIGNNNTVIGHAPENMGDGNTIINFADANGNTILNRPMVIGKGARGGPGDIVIGANAGGGDHFIHMMRDLEVILQKGGDAPAINAFQVLCSELNKPKPDKSVLAKLWGIIQASATVAGALSLLDRIKNTLGL